MRAVKWVVVTLGAALVLGGTAGAQELDELEPENELASILRPVVAQQIDQVIKRVFVGRAKTPSGTPTNAKRHIEKDDEDEEDFDDPAAAAAGGADEEEVDEDDEDDDMGASGVDEAIAKPQPGDVVSDKRSHAQRKARLGSCLAVSQQVLKAAGGLLPEEMQSAMEKSGPFRPDDLQRMLVFSSMAACYSKIDQELADELMAASSKAVQGVSVQVGTIGLSKAAELVSIAPEDPIMFDSELINVLEELIREFTDQRQDPPPATTKSKVKNAPPAKKKEFSLISISTGLYFTVIIGGLSVGFYQIYAFLREADSTPKAAETTTATPTAAEAKKAAKAAAKESKKKR